MKNAVTVVVSFILVISFLGVFSYGVCFLLGESIERLMGIKFATVDILMLVFSLIGVKMMFSWGDNKNYTK